MNLDLELSSEAQLLTSYALFNSLFWDENESALQGTHKALFPFLVTALKRIDGEIVTLDEVAERLRELFGLSFPQDILKGMLKNAWREKLLTRKTEKSITFLTVDRKALERLPDTEERASKLRHDHGEFVRELRRFGREQFSRSLNREEGEAALHRLMLERIDSISTVRDYSSVVSDWSPGMSPNDAGYILRRFIEEEVTPGSDLHEYLDRIAKGSALAVAIFYRGDQPRRLASSMQRLSVYFDTPLLLSLLGYHKDEDQEAATDVLRLVVESGARPCVFNHTCEELRNVLLGAVQDMKSAVHGQALESSMPVVETFVQASLERRNRFWDRAKYIIEAEQLPVLLERDHGFKVVPSSNQPADNASVAAFGDILKLTYSSEPSQRTIEFDVASILGIDRIRRSKTFRHLGDSKAIFVTSNPRLAEAADLYFNLGPDGDQVPACYTSDALANLLWLKRPLDLPNVPWRQIVSYVYAGLYPGDDLWRRYTDLLDEVRQSEASITDEDYFILRFTVGARRALMDDTLGDPGLLTVGSIAEILLKARDRLTNDLQSELQDTAATLLQMTERIGQLEDCVAEKVRERNAASAEIEELRCQVPFERLKAVEETLHISSRKLARRERRLLEFLAGIGIVTGFGLSLLSYVADGPAPLPLGVAVAVLLLILSVFGFMNMKRGWTFEAFEKSAAAWHSERRLNEIIDQLEEVSD